MPTDKGVDSYSAFLMPNPVTNTIQPHADTNTIARATCRSQRDINTPLLKTKRLTFLAAPSNITASRTHVFSVSLWTLYPCIYDISPDIQLGL